MVDSARLTMSYEFYKVIHLFGIMLLFSSLGGAVVVHAIGNNEQGASYRKLLSALHGISLVLILVAGGGLMARKGIMSLPPPMWINLKVIIWLLLGAALVVVKRAADMGRVWLVAMPLIGAIAAYLAAMSSTPS